MIIPPYYLLPSERDLKHHFRRIEANINLPISIYNNPPRTGVNMSVPLLVELSQMEKVVTIKQSSKMRRLAGGYSRAPITDLSEDEQRVLTQMSERVGLKPVYRPA